MVENPLDQVEEPGPDINVKNAWKHIWLYPSNVFKSAVRSFPGKYVSMIFALAGISSDISLGFFTGIFNNNWILSALFALAGSMLLSYLLSELYAWILFKIGILLGGKQELVAIRTVLAWAYIPTIAASILSFADLAVYVQNSVLGNVKVENNFVALVLPVLSIIQTILTLWSFVLIVIGIKTIQGFGIFKSLANVLLPILPMILALLILFVIFF